jgi:hypothetical protein
MAYGFFAEYVRLGFEVPLPTILPSRYQDGAYDMPLGAGPRVMFKLET